MKKSSLFMSLNHSCNHIVELEIHGNCKRCLPPACNEVVWSDTAGIVNGAIALCELVGDVTIISATETLSGAFVHH